MASNTFSPNTQVAGTSGVDGTNKDRTVQVGALQVGATLLTEDEIALLDSATVTSGDFGLISSSSDATSVGALAAAPLRGTVDADIDRVGNFFSITFTLTAASIPVTDAGGSGSSGSLQLWDFPAASVVFLGCRQNYTAFDESDLVTFTGDIETDSAVVVNVSALTGLYVGQFVTGSGVGAAGSSRIASIDSATQITLDDVSTATTATLTITAPALTGGASGGDAAFKMGVGTVAANAGDGALTSTEVDIGTITGTLTNTAGTTTGTLHSCVATVADGTSTPVDIFLNWSGTATTIDASGCIRVTGTITVVGVLMGDD